MNKLEKLNVITIEFQRIITNMGKFKKFLLEICQQLDLVLLLCEGIHSYTLISFRSSQQRCSVKKCVLRNFAKFARKHLCRSLVFNKVAGKICDISKNTFFIKHLRTTASAVYFTLNRVTLIQTTLCSLIQTTLIQTNLWIQLILIVMGTKVSISAGLTFSRLL